MRTAYAGSIQTRRGSRLAKYKVGFERTWQQDNGEIYGIHGASDYEAENPYMAAIQQWEALRELDNIVITYVRKCTEAPKKEIRAKKA